MTKNNVIPIDRYGYDFIPAEYLPKGENEYWLRNAQQAERFSKKPDDWRKLKPEEIEILLNNKNFCANWNDFLVCDPFDPALIRNSYFYGLIRIGTLRNVLLKHHDFCVPAGIRYSTLISCDVGDDSAIQNCAYVSNYIIGNNCILSEVNELQTTYHAKFGNGEIKESEQEDVRVWIDVMNEAGGRSILPFDNMIAADAYLWAAYRDDIALNKKLTEITQNQYGGVLGRYGIIGSNSVIKSCKIIKDTMMGDCTYIKGANKLKNITILSSADEPTQIGEGVEIVNGIVGYACNVFYGSKAVRFVMGRNCNLKYGARLIHSVLGDNSTVSCCEILNNLIFPVHEQHHNNSFLIASLIQGMSNMAAAATIGSNHNSRANDGEIQAKRGFWPGLAVSLKHTSVFASFIIIAKGDYPSEMNISLPFALVNNNVFKNRLEVLPAFYWMHNLYALERNSWKTKNRDKRKIKIQHIESDYLAPDTAEEIINALSLIENLLDEMGIKYSSQTPDDENYVREISCPGFEHSNRDQVIIKPIEAITSYRQMLRYYAIKTIIEYFDTHPDTDCRFLIELQSPSPSERIKNWTNFGGQIVPSDRIDELREDINAGKYKTWDEIHNVYNQWNDDYPLGRYCHAWAVLAYLAGTDSPIDIYTLRQEIESTFETRKWIDDLLYESRHKDFFNPFKQATFRNAQEMEQVLGKPEDNTFIRLYKTESENFIKKIERVLARLRK
ncbi:MAG: DUF4954 family protein [Treponema sp.]|nr:DUF4954 family protein [Treponema sp.]MCL2250584.1 DUF4954 family protein [Treponema sp.]